MGAKPAKKGNGKTVQLWIKDPDQLRSNANQLAQLAFERYGVDLLDVHKRKRLEGQASLSAVTEWAVDVLLSHMKNGDV